MLESLSPKQEALLDKVAAEYIDGLTKAPRTMNMRAVNAWLDIVYGFYDTKRPRRVEVVDSPHAALLLASELTKEPQTYMEWCGVGDGGWVSFYDYFRRIGILLDSEEETGYVIALREFGKTAWDMVLLDECAIVVRRPERLTVDEEGNLHSFDGPCIVWRDGEKDFAHHGTWIPERMVTAPRSYTRDEYAAITNTEERRALGERAGWDHIADLLGAQSIDIWMDSSTGLAYELLRCSDGSNLLRKQSPKLKNSEQPTYVEPVHEHLKTARAARKWQATTLTPEECERDPALTYSIEA